MSLICLTLTAPDIEGMRRQIDSCLDWIDLVEIRIDLLAPSERAKAAIFARHTNLPTILVISREQEGGQWGRHGETEDDRVRLFEQLLATGRWNWVDLEYDGLYFHLVHAAHRAGCRILRSLHDLSETFLDKPLQGIINFFNDTISQDTVPKLVVRCTSSRQFLAITKLSRALEAIPEKILYGMDEYGDPSCILSARFGSLWTYTTSSRASVKLSTGFDIPNRLHPSILNELYRFRDIREGTPLYAVTGRPVSHSQSPLIQNRWLKECDLRGTYIPILSDDLGDLLETCELLGIDGLSVTAPHKEKALALSNQSDELSRSIGAANTLVRYGDGWHAYNTDSSGFMSSLLKALGLTDKREIGGLKALVIGAGGAARAAVHALAKADIHLVILNRTVEKAAKLALRIGAQYGPLHPDSRALTDGVDIAIQTTSIGMSPDSISDPIPWWNPDGCTLVYDMIYNPPETMFLKRAAAYGVPIANGMNMLRAQAALQFELFTGIRPIE